MMMGVPSKSICASIALVVMAACGGASTQTPVATTPTVTNPPAPSAASGLGDTSDTTVQSVSFVGNSADVVALFMPSSGQAVTNSATLTVLDAGVNAGLSDVSILNGEEFVYIPASGNVPDGTATYFGNGFLKVTDGTNSSVFEGTANAKLELVLNGAATGSIEFGSFQGMRLLETTPTSTSGQRIKIEGITASAAGFSGGSSVSIDTFTDVDFAGANYDINGVFAGVDYSEVGGVLTVIAPNGSISAGFGGEIFVPE